jgi:hypothetical protein
MKKVKNKLQVRHYAQVPCEPFCVDVVDEIDAKRISDILADQHLFLFDQRIIPDYANIISVVMWDDTPDEENNNQPYGWVDYLNEEECMEWDEFEQTYLIK